MNSDQMYDAVQIIRNTRGLNAKKAVLSGFPELKNMLHTTYNPYMQFGLTPNTKWVTGVGTEHFSKKTAQLLTDLVNRRITGTRAKRAVTKHIQELSYKSAYLLILILNKSLDFGLGIKSINQVFPDLIPVHPLQLAHLYTPKKCKFPCYVSPKLDGLRSIYKWNTFFSRRGHVFRGLSYVQEEVRAILKLMPPDTVLDGELMVDGEHFDEISGQIRAFTEADNARYNIFDVPSLHDKPFFQRNQFLEHWDTQIGKEFSHITFITHTKVQDEESIHDKYEEYREYGFEGVMVKQAHSLYQSDRTYDWMKMKPTESVDCKIIGIFEGDGKYMGMAGGVIVDFNGVPVRVGSGLSDSQRAFWYQDPDEIIGRTAEILYQNVTPAGSLRHPRLKGLRGDK